MKRAAEIVIVLALCAACASGKDSVDLTKPLTGAAASDAAKAYEKGMTEKREKNYLEATRYFEAVRSGFPYSQFAALSELAIADMDYDRDEYTAAAHAYQDFVKSHPSHPKADYAAFRVGLANYEDKPGDFFMLPPSYERDQAPVRGALEALQRFVVAYPKSEYVTRARDLINDCRQRLANHDRYVVGFYWKKKAWLGAAARLISIADTYGDLDNGKLRSDSLWRAAVAYQLANDAKDQRETLQRLAQEAAPGDPHRAYAEQMLKSLPPPPASPEPPAKPE
jgi:outer membrane protein assembly factor BamD